MQITPRHLTEAECPYPRICAHRGFNTIAPESTLPAFGAAIALGADEIEFDIWRTTDGRYVLCHDPSLDRVSDGHGRVDQASYEDLKKLDFGAKFNERFKGLRVLTLEDVLAKFQHQIIINLHIKPENDDDDCRRIITDVAAILKDYDMQDYVYFMTGYKPMMAAALKYAPEIPRCMGEGHEHWQILDNAIAYHCQKAQFFIPYFDQAMLDKAHECNIRCNLFHSEQPDDAVEWVRRGIETVLTNDYLSIANAIHAM